MKAFHFATAVWGGEYTDTFTAVTLPSLLSNSNIPKVVVNRRCYYSIYTTARDEEKIRLAESFRRLSKIVSIKFERISDNEGDNKYKIASESYLRASLEAANSSQIIVYIIPDVIISDGSVHGLSAIFEEGKKAVLIASMRCIKESLLLKIAGNYTVDGALTVKPRELVSLAIDSIHPIMKFHMYDELTDGFHPSFFVWKVAQKGFILHNVHPQPFAIDMTGQKLEFSSTIDDDLLGNLDIKRENVKLVQDSDEILCFELSRESQTIGLPTDKSFLNIFRWMESATNDAGRFYMRMPVYVHSDDLLANGDWKMVEMRSQMVASTFCNLFELNGHLPISIQGSARVDVEATRLISRQELTAKLIAICGQYNTLSVLKAIATLIVIRSRDFYLKRKRRRASIANSTKLLMAAGVLVGVKLFFQIQKFKNRARLK